MKIIKVAQVKELDPYAAINQKVSAMVKVFADNYAEILSSSRGGRAIKTYEVMKRLADEVAEDLYRIRSKNKNEN